MMIFINECYRVDKVNRDMIINFIKLLSPIAPHMCEEVYQHYTGRETIAYESWPTYDPSKLVLNDVTVVVQVNGKVRGKIETAKDSDDEAVKAKALELESACKVHDAGTIMRRHEDCLNDYQRVLGIVRNALA